MGNELEKQSPYKILKVYPKVERPLEEVIEGRKRLELIEAQAEADKALQKNPNDTPMFIGGIETPSKTNVLYSGLTQSGKTSAMKVTLHQVLERIKKGSKEKLIFYASSAEYIPFVYAYCGDAPVYIMNPSDARCYQWDLSKDLRSTANTLDFTHTLVRERQGDTPFFTEGARSLLSAILNAFFLTTVRDKKNLEWTLADVANAIRTEERIKAVLGLQPEKLNYIAENFLDRQNKDVLASLTARTQELQSVAVFWQNRPRFSMREFLDPTTQGGILILGEDADNRATVIEVNRLLLERAGKMLADRDECPEARYWFFLDEFQQLGKMDTLKRLVKDGLKRGIRVHLACQNQADIIATYGREDAQVLFYECGTHLIFKHNHEDSAQEAVKVIGKQKKRRWLRSSSISITQQEGHSTGYQESDSTGYSSTSGGNSSSSTNSTTHGTSKSEGVNNSISAGFTSGRGETIVREYAVEPEGLLSLEEGDFYAVTNSVSGFWKHRYDWRLLKGLVEAKSEKPEHARKIEPDEMVMTSMLNDWSDEDKKRLGLDFTAVKVSADATQRPKKASKDENEEDLFQQINERFGQ